MNKAYFEKNKGEIFPWVKDWTDPQDHIRHEKNINKLTYYEWFYLHPSSFKLFSFGINAVSVVIFGICSWFLFSIGRIMLGVIPSIIVIFNLGKIFNKAIELKNTKDMTFYDLWMREYTSEVK